MINDTPIFTQAFNFISAAAGRVDPRTGLFLFNFPVGKLVGNDGRGPELPLVLRYSPMLTTNLYGLGMGISLGLSSYDGKKKILTLNTGETYKISESDSTAWVRVKQHKLENFQLQKSREGNNVVYCVTYKTGEREFLTTTSGGQDLSLPYRLESPQGFVLKLHWDTHNRLEKIADEQDHCLCKFEYSARAVTITQWPELQGPAPKSVVTIDLLFTTAPEGDQYLTTIKNLSLSHAPLTWQLGYSWNDLPAVKIYEKALLTRVEAPTGLQETVVYDPEGMKVTAEFGIAYLPAVKKFTVSPGFKQPDQIEEYSYSATNYLGGGQTYSGRSDDDDLLYGMPTDYEYQSTVTYRPPAGQSPRTVTRTYNSYHLLISEDTQNGRCRHIEKTEYLLKPHFTFENQPAVFQMPCKKTSTWINEKQNKREEVTTYDYEKDDHHVYKSSGNLVSQTAPDGTVSTYTYYPTSGIPGACPKDPYNFTRFLWVQTVTPPRLKGDELVHITTRTYGVLPHDGNIVVVSKKASIKGVDSKKEETLSAVKYTYEDQKNSPNYRCLKQTDITMYDRDGKAYNSVQTTAVSKDVAKALLTSTTETTTWDSLKLQSSHSVQAFTGQKLSEIDAAGNRMEHHYDALGRLEQTVLHPDKAEYKATETFTYILPVAEDKDKNIRAEPARTIHMDSRNNETRVSYDGLGRQILREIRDQDADDKQTWHPINQTEWDAFGRKKTVSATDQLPVVKDGKIGTDIQTISHALTTEWDDWGEPCKVTDSIGIVHHSDTDPVGLTKSVWVSDTNSKHESAREVTIFEAKTHRPIKKEIKINQDGALTTYSAVSQVWDGMGRLREASDELGNTTAWQYDPLGRVTETTYPDSSKITKTYEGFSSAELINSISVVPHGKAEIKLGTQSFDGLGRLKTTASGGRRWVYTYDHAWQKTPSTQTGPTGPDAVTSKYTQDPLLGGAIKSVTAEKILQNFNYDLSSGQLHKAFEGSETQTCTTLTPYASGRLQKESVVLLEGGAVETTWHYSLGGLPVMINSNGVSKIQGYQATGRLERITDDAVEVTLKYDELGRLCHWDATERLTKALMSTELTFDRQGREWKRKMSHSNGSARLIRQEWKKNNQLASRHHYGKDENTAVLSEAYEYDNRNRLITYTCTGTELPSDPYGNPFARQDFEFDVLSNITVCRTTLTDGRVNEARYFFENKEDPCQLSGVTNGAPGRVKESGLPAASAKKTPEGYPETIVLVYDHAGRMTRDEAGRSLTYDALGRLATVTGGHYGYDAHNRMVYQKVDKTQAAHRLYYRANRLIEEWVTKGEGKPDAGKDSRVRLVYAAGGCVAQAERRDNKTEVMLTGTDAKHSVVTTTEGSETQTTVYTPYGYRKGDGESGENG